MIATKESDRMICSHCGQACPHPTKAGLWEYISNPQFNLDGSLVTEMKRTIVTSYKEDKVVNPPITEIVVDKVNQVWQRVSIVDISHLGCQHQDLLLIPSGSKRTEEWPKIAIWRKVGDAPEIIWQDVIQGIRRLGDCEFNDDGTIKKWGTIVYPYSI